MSTSRLRGSFIIGGIISVGSVIALVCDVPTLPQTEGMQGFLTGILAVGAIAPMLFFIFKSWKMADTRESSQDQMDFMYKMTHELQTPVASIALSADMLANQAVINTPERVRKYVKMIKEESNRMQWHIENVLHMARADNQGLLLKLEKVPINELILSILERYEEQVKIDLNAPETLVSMDRQHFTNVLHNLIDNAQKYTPDHPLIRIGTYLNGNSILVSVKDNGIGIAKSEQKKIFKNFYRIQDNSSHIKGFGLGLSYVQQIVNAHSWQLEVVSSQGEGSDFRIIIPTG